MATSTSPAPYLVVSADGVAAYIASLTAAQSDGISCVSCHATGVPKVPVGRCYPAGHCVLRGGVQVFRCSGGCEVTS